jgi:hypothetical protein
LAVLFPPETALAALQAAFATQKEDMLRKEDALAKAGTALAALQVS